VGIGGERGEGNPERSGIVRYQGHNFIGLKNFRGERQGKLGGTPNSVVKKHYQSHNGSCGYNQLGVCGKSKIEGEIKKKSEKERTLDNAMSKDS